MYLESIFVAGDIRAQLPEEAKKFDNIDKLFKKVQTCTNLHSLLSILTPCPCPSDHVRDVQESSCVGLLSCGEQIARPPVHT